MGSLNRRALRSTHGVTYETFSFLREDNVFLSAPDLALVGHGGALDPHDNHPHVIVDEFCGFGSFSDKIYFANKPGAQRTWQGLLGSRGGVQ